MAEHTPGPWGYFIAGGRTGADPVEVAFLIGPKQRTRERSQGFAPEDARLIAAAPEMLEALIDCVHLIADDSYPETIKARAIIAKATSASDVSGRSRDSGTNHPASPTGQAREGE